MNFEDYLRQEFEVEKLYQRCEPMFSNTLEEYNCESCLEVGCEHWKKYND